VSELLNTKKAAAYLGMRPSTLESWRSHGKGPPYIKMGPRMIRYRVYDLNNWLENSMVEK